MKADKLSINKKYYLGRLQFPGAVTFDDGAVFLVFTSEEGTEELQIAVDDSTRRKKEKDFIK